MEWEMLIKGLTIFISCSHFDEGMGASLAISVEDHPILWNNFEIKQLTYVV